MRLDRDARYWHQLWSMRIAFGVALLGGVWAALPAFQTEMPPLYFALTCMGASVLIMIARVTHQKGLPDD